MEWSAQITNKSEVTSDGQLTYEFIVLGDGEAKNGTFSVTGVPDSIQQLIENQVTAFAQAYELADELPNVGDVLPIITNS